MSLGRKVEAPGSRRGKRIGKGISRTGRIDLLVVILVSLSGVTCSAGSTDSGPDSAGRDKAVTAVRGESWLKHLGLQVSGTRMGQMGGTSPAPEAAPGGPGGNEGTGSPGRRGGPGTRGGMAGGGMGIGGGGGLAGAMQRFLSHYRSGNQEEASKAMNETFYLTGGDLYRLNCQSCHGPDGQGAPPEINSLIDPVRATSPDAILEQWKQRGRTIPRAMAERLAAQADSSLRQRLANGGTKMPAFTHLRGDEITALLSYLEVLAGAAPASQAAMRVPQSAARVGEHLVKGTCHICHDATGPGGGHMAMRQGIIPSLASMPRETSLSSVERQVHYGSSGMMMMMGGQRMPALPYISQEEIAAAYFYLEEYPPVP